MGITRFAGLLSCVAFAFVCLLGIPAAGVQAQIMQPYLVWESRYNHPYSEDKPSQVITDNAGSIYVTGIGEGQTGGSPDFLTVKYDSYGTEGWKARYGLLTYDFDTVCDPNYRMATDTPVGIGLDEAGNVYVGGLSTYTVTCYQYGTRREDYMTTVKYDPDGIQVWVARNAGEAAAMAVNEYGDTFMAGTHYTYDQYGYETSASYVTAKLDTLGQKHWSVRYDDGSSSQRNLATDIALGELGLIHVTGRSLGEETGYDYATTTYGPHGTELYVNRYDGPAGGDDLAEAIFVNGLGEVFVTGSSEGAGTGRDFATVKYSALGGEVWVARYNGPADGRDEAVSVAGDPLGNVYVTGTSEGLASGADIVTVAYSFFGHEVWRQRYDGPASGNDSASSVIVTTAGDVVMTGKSEGSDSDEDYVTICYESSSGAVLWTARYDGPASTEDAATSATPDGSGNVIVTGHSRGVKTGPDYATIKYGAGGSELWTARFENPGMGATADTPSAMALDPLGNICVAGSSAEPDSSGFPVLSTSDYAVVKIDPEGNQLWEASYDGPSGMDDIARDIAVDTMGNVHVTGGSDGFETGEDYLTVKYDPAGSELWVARHDGPESADDVAETIALDPGGNILVTGTSEGTGTGGDYLTVKYDPAGSQLWTARYDGDANTDEAVDLSVDAAGNVYVTGCSTRSGTDEDYATIKYDPNGSELWIASYNGPMSLADRANDLALDGAGNVYVTGRSRGSSVSYDYDYATIKYDADGNELWVARYNGLTIDRHYGIALVVDTSGNVYVTGSSGDDAATIKYDPDGNELWVARRPAAHGNQDISVAAIAVDTSGSVYVAGRIFYWGTWGRSSSNILLLKYDTLGNVELEILYSGPYPILNAGSNGVEDLLLDPGGDFYIAGYSRLESTYGDFATLRYTHDLTCNDPDGDGFGAPWGPECTYYEWDCDNSYPEVNPYDREDDWEECHNGIDDDCDGFVDATVEYLYYSYISCPCVDQDGDGYGVPPDNGGCGFPEEDCNDNNPLANPAGLEIPYNDIDDDCDGDVDETDCFIATAAFGSEMEGRIEVLRDFRDEVLMDLPAGRALVQAYYELSPPVAEFIARHGWLRALVRALLLPLVGAASLLT